MRVIGEKSPLRSKPHDERNLIAPTMNFRAQASFAFETTIDFNEHGGHAMSGVRVLAFALFVVVHAASQDPSKMFPYPLPQDGPSSLPVQARCKFSDGKTITVDYSTRHVKTDLSPFDLRPTGGGWATVFNGITFVTDE